MFGIKLPFMNSSPKAAIEMIVNEVEKKLKEPVNHLLMTVDFSVEKIILSIPEKNISEVIDSSFMFMLISQAVESHLEIKNTEIVALMIDYKRNSDKLDVKYFYIKDGEKIKDQKFI